MNYKRSLIITLVFFALVLAGCQKNTTSVFPDINETYSENLSALGSVNRFAGVVTSSGETKIEKDETKTISEVLVSAGDDVKEGQLLFVYDSEQAQLNYDKASLELDQLNYTLQSYNEQKAALEREKANADSADQLSYTLQIQETDTNIRETSYNIGLKEKEVEKLQKGLEDLEVKSPVTGKVQSINADGALDRNGNAMPYMVIMNTGKYRVMAHINEMNANDMLPGDEVLIRSRVDDSTWTGFVDHIDFDNPVQASQNMYSMDDSSDSGLTASSKYPVYIELENADGLILGQHVFVEKEMDITYTEEANDPAEGTPKEDSPMGDTPIEDIPMEDMTMGDSDAAFPPEMGTGVFEPGTDSGMYESEIPSAVIE